MVILAWVALVRSAIGVGVSPFVIGKPRSPYGAGDYLGTMFEAAIVVALAGRVLGWW